LGYELGYKHLTKFPFWQVTIVESTCLTSAQTRRGYSKLHLSSAEAMGAV